MRSVVAHVATDTQLPKSRLILGGLLSFLAFVVSWPLFVGGLWAGGVDIFHYDKNLIQFKGIWFKQLRW